MKVGLPARKMDRRYAYGDYRLWPDDERWELIDGVAWNMSPAPSWAHQCLSTELVWRIRSFLEGRPCQVVAAPFDVLLPDSPDEPDDRVGTVVQPDIAVICAKDKIRSYGCRGAPDWVIEILSPWTSKKDLSEKHELYQRHGVREYWVVDPGNRYVQVYLLGTDGRYPDPKVHVENDTVPSAVCEGLSVGLGDLFAAIRA